MILKISKYDPSADSAPYFITVEVDWHNNITLLEALQFAYEKTPVSFDYNCRGRQCGRCAVMFDGTPVMACCTFMTDATHIIEPLKGFPVLRDLIVYKKEAHDAITKRYDRIKDPSLDLTKLQVLNDNYNTAAIEQIDAIEWCARCMACTAACPAHKANPQLFVGPAEMLAIAYRYYDRYDAGNREAEAVGAGLWNCIMCGQCDFVCPQKEIKRVKQIWKDLRAGAEAAGYKNPNA